MLEQAKAAAATIIEGVDLLAAGRSITDQIIPALRHRLNVYDVPVTEETLAALFAGIASCTNLTPGEDQCPTEFQAGLMMLVASAEMLINFDASLQDLPPL